MQVYSHEHVNDRISVISSTTHGIPQRGALSTILFAAYMEEPLRHIHRDGQTFFREPQHPDNTFITTSYVDDCDFISTDPYALSIINVLLSTYFIH